MKIIFWRRSLHDRMANLIEELLPEHVIRVKIEKDLEKGFDYRKICIGEA